MIKRSGNREGNWLDYKTITKVEESDESGMMERKGINVRNGNGERVRGINRGIEENNSESEMEARKREIRRESLKERVKECRKEKRKERRNLNRRCVTAQF